MGRSRIIEGHWDCAFCETKEIRGGLRNCPNCGKPRDEHTKFEMNANSRVLSDAEAKTIDRDPDWECSFCGNLNPDESLTCISCGGNKDDKKGTYFDARKEDAEKEAYLKEQEQKQRDLEHNYANDSSAIPKFNLSSDFIKKLLIGAGSVLGVVAFIWLLVLLFTPKVETINVLGFSWERNIEIEEIQTFEEDDWDLPYGARLLYTQEEISGHKDVIAHYETVEKQVSHDVYDHTDVVVIGTEDLGNGYFEEITDEVDVYRTEYTTEYDEEPVYRQDPIYDTKYYYEIDRWVTGRNLSTSGTDKEPFWDDVQIWDDEREGDRTERYSVKVKNEENEIETLSLDYSKWMALENGQTLKVKVVFGTVVEILSEK